MTAKVKYCFLRLAEWKFLQPCLGKTGTGLAQVSIFMPEFIWTKYKPNQRFSLFKADYLNPELDPSDI